MTDLRGRLDRLVPDTPAEGDWDRVLADGERPRRRRLSLALPVVAAAAAIAVLALAWPFGSEQPGGVLDRALAAIGEGPVLHIVYRGEWGATYVDLSSGEVTPVAGESELWYDPKRGVHHVSRLGSNVIHEWIAARSEVSVRQEEQFLALAEDYRTALATGKARLAGPGRVGDRDVLWIRVRSEWLPDSSDGRDHLFAEEVAVDRQTYEPIYARSTRDGRPPLGGGQAIAKLERLAADEGDFEADAPDRVTRDGMIGSAEFGDALEPEDYARVVGGAAFWLGPTYDGEPLADASEFIVKRRPNPNVEWEKLRGLYLFYGKLRRKGDVLLRALSKPAVVLEEFREPPSFWFSASYASAAREGSVLFAGLRSAVLLRDGTYVSIQAPSVRAMLEAAAALRPSDTTSAPSSDLDFAAIAREVEAQEVHGVEVSGGGKPVAPRPIVRRRGRLVQTGTSKGITVRAYSGGVVQFDTRGMDGNLKRVVPRTMTWHCFRLREGEPTGWGGGYGSIPRSGIKSVAVLGHMPRGRRVSLRPPFDVCELGTGFGRDWLRRFRFHGLLELPLTNRGRRYFDERAAARELAYFVRTGSRQRARSEMRAGHPAPPAERLYDRAHPEIAVAARGDRFTASLTASTGRRFFVEIVRGRVHRTNAKRLAAAYLK